MSDKPDGSGSVTNEKDLGNQKYVLSVPPGEPTEPQQADGRLAQLRAFAVKKLQDDQVSRRAGAVFTGLAGMVVIIVCLFWSISSLPDFRDGINKVQNVSQERLVWAVIAGHAVITIAWVFFGYQLLRMAERFALPLNHAHRARRCADG